MKFVIRLTVAITLLLGAEAAGQGTPTEVVQLALQRVGSGAVDQGIHLLDSLVAVQPEFVQGWAALGQVYRQKPDYAASLTAYQKAVESGIPAPNLVYQVGVAYAFEKDINQAFAWLLQAKATNAINMANFDGSPAAENLRDDPRYSSLFPSEREMAAPFVEPVGIIHEWRGESRSDQFGWIARNVGDVDGDGINDMATSAPTWSGSGTQAGKVYTYSGSSGAILWTAIGRSEGGQLGSGIESAGDMNGDGIPDVVASAPYTNEVFIYSGNDGRMLSELKGLDSKGAFGNQAKGIGDVNGDGFGDILVGEPFQIFGSPINGGDGTEAGRAWVFSGRDGAVLLTLEGEASGDAFGTAVAGATIDGKTYFMVGAPGAGPRDTGRTYVYSDLSGEPQFVMDPGASGASMGGMFLSVVGDVNGDGTPDMYASDWADGTLGPSTGRVYVHSGKDGSRLLELGGEAAGDGFGIGISDAGDVNRDGYDDLIIGAWQHAGAAPSGGKLYVHSGRDGSLMRQMTGRIAGETLGFDTTGMGDVDGDGIVDFLVTSAWSMINGFRSGRVYLLSGAHD